MAKHYYIDRSKKQIFVYDTKPDSIDLEFLGSSDNPHIKSQASMFVRGGVGFQILTPSTNQT